MKVATVKCKSYALAKSLGAKMTMPVGPYIEVQIGDTGTFVFWECVDGALTWPAGAA